MQKLAAFKASVSSEINQDSVSLPWASIRLESRCECRSRFYNKIWFSKFCHRSVCWPIILRLRRMHSTICYSESNQHRTTSRSWSPSVYWLLLTLCSFTANQSTNKDCLICANFTFDLSFRFLVPTISGVMPILYFQKLVKTHQRELVESKLSKFIVSLDNYESAIKKNKTFLHETQVIKSAASVLKRYDKDNSLTTTLITSIKTVINALYRFVRLLESFPLAAKLRLGYEPFEDLQDCELMTMNLEGSVDIKIIKVSFEVFYFRSFLTNKTKRKI